MSNDRDLVIVGAGPAGLAAALYGSRLGLRTLAIAETLGGMAGEASWVENYPGVDGESGIDLVERMRKQCESAGAELLLGERVEGLDLAGTRKCAIVQSGSFESDAVILASGCSHRRLGIPGEEEFSGRGVSYCAVCDGVFFKGKRVLVVGGGNTAAMEALFLEDIAGEVFMAHRKSDLRADAVLKRRVLDGSVQVLWRKEVEEISGDGVVTHAILRDTATDDVARLEVDGIFVAVGKDPVTGFAKEAGIATADGGFIDVNRKQETNIRGVYAAGDVTGGIHQIGVAVGEGITAAMNAYLYVRGGWYGSRNGRQSGDS
jgi:thioredoxin reductase (NADPH)